MADCSTCGGSGTIPLLGPNETDCPDCNQDENGDFDIHDLEMAVWYPLGNFTCRLKGTSSNPEVSFNPMGGVVVWVDSSRWVATTTSGNTGGKCVDLEKLARFLQNHDNFEFRPRQSAWS